MKKIKVLHIIAGDLSGGAAKGALNLHYALLKEDIDSQVITNVQLAETERLHSVIRNNFFLLRRKLMSFFFLLVKSVVMKKKSEIFSFGIVGFDFTKLEIYKTANVIHLHWANGLLNLGSLKGIDKPIIWTLRDIWPLTGGCHVYDGCTKFYDGCYACEKLKYSFPDLAKINYERKMKLYSNNIFVVGLSSWISTQAKQTRLFKNHSISTISNIINDEFVKFDKVQARNELCLDLRKKIILLGTINFNDTHKGFDLFAKALKYLRSTDKYLFCFFGQINSNLLNQLGINYVNLGHISDKIYLSKLYSSSDVFVAPYRSESFGKTIAESMKCGTPVVSFNFSGPVDIIDHRLNGYLAEPFFPEDLAHGIEWILDHPNYEELSGKARKKIEDKFNSKRISEQYIELYRAVIEEQTNG